MRALALALLVACQSAKPSEPAKQAPPVPTSPRGEVVRTSFESAALGVKKDVLVYLPAGYATSTQRYPVFYYLHGLGGAETNWVQNGKLDETADALGLQAIVVMPDGDNGFYTDSVTPVDYEACMRDGTGLFIPDQPRRSTCVKAPRYEEYITKDLIAWVDATYRTLAAREGRAIAGLSMGGFGALKLALRHPQLFSAAASHSGVDSLLYIGPDPYVRAKVQLETEPKNWLGRGPFPDWVRGVFGTDIANWRAHDPTTLVETLEPGALALYLDCGTDDEFSLHLGAQYLHDLLLEKKIEHAWYLGPGRHDMVFWRERLPHSLRFLASKVSAPRYFGGVPASRTRHPATP